MAKPPTHLPCGTAHWSTEKCPARTGKAEEPRPDVAELRKTIAELEARATAAEAELENRRATDRARAAKYRKKDAK